MADDFAFPPAVPYGALSAKHEDWDGDYLRRLRALYKGGKALLRCPSVLQDVFPRHGGESDEVYGERCRRAFYVPYAGAIINFISASLGAERLSLKQPRAEGAKEDPPLPDWYKAWFEDVSPKGGKTVSLHDFVKSAVTDALVARVAWARVDLPEAGEYATLADQEKAGALDAFVVPIPAESVIDWEEDDSGELQFAVVHTIESKRKGLTDARDQVTEVFRVYTPTESARYEFTHKRCDQVNAQTVVPLVKRASHTFGRVPLFRLDVGDGLWAMDNLEGQAREHMNKRSALAWAEFQSLFQELYEFLGPEQAGGANPVIGQAQTDANRAVSQRRGQGYVQERGKEDRAEFVGPDPASFAEARKSCEELRSEIFRVLHQMALAADNSAAALRRSADSKGQDKASAVVVFTALGQLARKFAEDIVNLVSAGRQEKDLAGKWQASGMAKFDAVSVDASIDQMTKLELIKLPSPTAQRLLKMSLLKTVLADEATPEDLEAIEDELGENITPESLQSASVPPFMPPPVDDETDDGKEDGSDEEPAVTRKKKPTKKRKSAGKAVEK